MKEKNARDEKEKERKKPKREKKVKRNRLNFALGTGRKTIERESENRYKSNVSDSRRFIHSLRVDRHYNSQ